jgi:hypothetical protein
VALSTFVGIGAPRAGTTWLNTLLASHPDVYTPTLRDEINFFDQYYDRGLAWYEALFCPPEGAERVLVVGEVTPQYLECEACPARIASALPESSLMVMLRHPVDRAYSQYGFFVQRRNYRGSFADFCVERPRALERGFYSRYLKRYLNYFDRTRILALVFEDAVKDVGQTKKALAGFLGIAVERFPADAGGSKVNPSSIPRFQLLYGLVAMTGRQLRRWRLEPVVDLVMRTRIPRVLAKGSALPPLDRGLRHSLSQRYRDEFDALEQCMQIDLSCWRA